MTKVTPVPETIYDTPNEIRMREIKGPDVFHQGQLSFSLPGPSTSEDSESQSWIMRKIDSCHESASQFISNNKKLFWITIGVVLFVLYHAYFGYAMYLKGNKALLTLTILAWLFGLYYLVFKPYLWPHCGSVKKGVTEFWKKYVTQNVLIFFQVLLVCAFIGFLLYDCRDDYFRLVPFSGMAAYLLLLWILSTAPGKVKWRPVIYGVALQIIMGLIVLRWKAGYSAFRFISDQVTRFLKYVDAGSGFVFGFTVQPSPGLAALGAYPVLLFGPLSVVVFFSSVVSALYYYGIVQWIIVRIGWLFRVFLGTTCAESLCAAGNIFIGQTEAPLLVKPYISRLTKSEIHAVMTCGFATIAGSVFGVYLSFGACPVHLLTACFMSAPAALACSKLMCPETDVSSTKDMDDVRLENTEDQNVLDAVSRGASVGMQLLLNIGANLIVFLSFLAFFNQIVQWLGEQVGIDGLSFEVICSYLFFPFAFLMGASDLADPAERVAEVLKVSRLMGVKTFLNEFIAYQQMGEMVHCCQLSRRAQLVATYALCGFSNFGSIGVLIGGLSSLCPERRGDIAANGIRALISGSVACFMTACLAGILTSDLEPCGDTGRFLGFNCTAKFGHGCNNTVY